MTVYSFTLFCHSLLRWAILVAGLLALGVAAHGWAKARAFTHRDERLHRAFVGFVDLQFLLGLGLYFFVSPIPARAAARASVRPPMPPPATRSLPSSFIAPSRARGGAGKIRSRR